MDIIDTRLLCQKVIKYLIEASAVSIACVMLVKNKLNIDEILSIALVSAAVFAILDLFSPTTGQAFRYGIGLSSGAGLMGGIPLK